MVGMKTNNNTFNLPDTTQLLNEVSNFVRDNQGEKGFISTYDTTCDIMHGCRYQEGFGGTELKEYRIVAVAFMDGELCCLLEDNMVDKDGHPVDVNDTTISERLDKFESVRYSYIMFVQTIYNIAEVLEEYLK